MGKWWIGGLPAFPPTFTCTYVLTLVQATVDVWKLCPARILWRRPGCDEDELVELLPPSDGMCQIAAVDAWLWYDIL